MGTLLDLQRDMGGVEHEDDGGEEEIDSDASDAEAAVVDKDFLRQLHRARARAKDTRPLVRCDPLPLSLINPHSSINTLRFCALRCIP